MKLNIATITASAAATLALGACSAPSGNAPSTTLVAATTEVPPAPAAVIVTPGDHNAILAWNGFPKEDGGSDAVTGYRVLWGRAGVAPATQLLTNRASAQLQPLENGVGYEATVEAVTWDGRVSPPSTPVAFTGDAARVDALRARMNGFFDDFSRPSGFPDASRWNTAVSACNLPAQDGFFINNQFHAHNKLSSRDGCAKGQSISRPRAVFDFTGRTGTITFDLDGAQRSDQWYLDFSPHLMDIGGQVGVEDGLDRVGARAKFRFAPGNMLRLHQAGQEVQVIWIDVQGYEHLVATGDAEKAGVPLLPNVRRPFEVHVSRHHVDIAISGTRVLSTDALDLPFSRAHLLWNAFSYDTRANSNEAAFLLHWGNFGFDAPAGPRPPVTHDYGDGVQRGTPPQLRDATDTRHIRIPDVLTGATAARLMLTLQASPGTAYEWSANDHVLVNGRRLDIPAPSGAGLRPDEVVTDESPFTAVLPIPPDVAVRGDNTVAVTLHQATFLNLHVELDFDLARAGAYTPPAMVSGWMAESATPAAIGIGPGVTIDSISGRSMAATLRGPAADVLRHRPVRVSGREHVRVSYQDDVALNGTGRIPGVSRLELLVDGRLTQTRRVDLQVASPGGTLDLALDTNALSDGAHTVEARAVGADGARSIPDYEAAATRSGDSRPLRVEVRNHPSFTQWLGDLLSRAGSRRGGSPPG